ncbi:MAG TPA: MFS transporter [Stellaceae bacterium]|nr:MFS transporter [Stellaceae bacterium]
MGDFFRNRWWVVFASICGLLVGGGAVNIFAFGVFLKPVTEDLGIGRGALSSGLIMSTTLSGLGLIPLGYMLDRWGARQVMIPGIALFALGVASKSFLTADPAVILTVFAVAGLFGCIGTPVPYGAVLSRWFDGRRGLAIGIATAGVGLGVALVPQIAVFLIGHYGWRHGFVGLGITIFALAWLPVALFVREPRDRDLVRHQDAPRGIALAGVTVWQALRSWRFWALTGAFAIAIASINGTLTHMVAFLTDRGISVQAATATLSASGVALLLGRVICGWCLDRFFGPLVAIGFFIVPMAGIGLLASGAGGLVPLAGAALCGLGVGAEVDLMAFFVSRYFGLHSYGKIYGTMFAVFSFANGIGSTIAGMSFDRYHAYGPAFMLFEGLLVLTCVLVAPLGAYPYPAMKRRRVSGGGQEVTA